MFEDEFSEVGTPQRKKLPEYGPGPQGGGRSTPHRPLVKVNPPYLKLNLGPDTYSGLEYHAHAIREQYMRHAYPRPVDWWLEIGCSLILFAGAGAWMYEGYPRLAAISFSLVAGGWWAVRRRMRQWKIWAMKEKLSGSQFFDLGDQGVPLKGINLIKRPSK